MKKLSLAYLMYCLLDSVLLFCPRPKVPSLVLELMPVAEGENHALVDEVMRRRASREFALFSMRLSYIEMMHKNLQQLGNADEGKIEQEDRVANDFTMLGNELYIWQNAHLDFLGRNVMFADDDVSMIGADKLNLYNDNMVPRMKEMALKLCIELPLVCKVVVSRSASPQEENVAMQPTGEQSLYELSELTVQVSEFANASLCRTPCIPRNRSSFERRLSGNDNLGEQV